MIPITDNISVCYYEDYNNGNTFQFDYIKSNNGVSIHGGVVVDFPIKDLSNMITALQRLEKLLVLK